jgi:hypothetical protein
MTKTKKEKIIQIVPSTGIKVYYYCGDYRKPFDRSEVLSAIVHALALVEMDDIRTVQLFTICDGYLQNWESSNSLGVWEHEGEAADYFLKFWAEDKKFCIKDEE